MELTDARIESYFALVGPTEPASRREQRAAWLRSRVSEGHFCLADIRVLLDAAGEVSAALGVDKVSASLAQLYPLQLRPEASGSERQAAVALLGEALERARQLGAARVTTRIQDAQAFPEYDAELERHGLRRAGRRIEYIAKLEALPSEGASPLSWHSMAEVPRQSLHQLLGDILQADPSPALYDSPEEALREMLGAPGFSHGDECVQLGRVGGEDAALVIAQVQAGTGLATITQLGLHGSFRGRGLGAYVLRHGFDMLRAQGGTYYRDGTALANAPMRRLFEQHGCREYARMTDWGAATGAAPSQGVG